MKILILLFLICCLLQAQMIGTARRRLVAGSSGTPPAIVNKCTNYGYQSAPLSCTVNVAAGHTLLAFNDGQLMNGALTGTVTSTGLSWTNLKQDTSNGFVAAYVKDTTGGSRTITITISGGTAKSNWFLTVVDISGANGLDGTAVYNLLTSANPNPITTSNFTPSTSNDLVIAIGGTVANTNLGTITMHTGSPYTLYSSDVGGGIAFLSNPTTGAATSASFDHSGGYTQYSPTLIFAFAPA